MTPARDPKQSFREAFGVSGEASGRHLEASGSIWRHLESFWEASGRPLGGLWEASGGSARLASPAKPAGTKNVNISLKPSVFHWFY